MPGQGQGGGQGNRPEKTDKPAGRDNRAQATVNATDAQTIASLLEAQGISADLVTALRSGGWVKVLGPGDAEPTA